MPHDPGQHAMPQQPLARARGGCFKARARTPDVCCRVLEAAVWCVQAARQLAGHVVLCGVRACGRARRAACGCGLQRPARTHAHTHTRARTCASTHSGLCTHARARRAHAPAAQAHLPLLEVAVDGLPDLLQLRLRQRARSGGARQQRRQRHRKRSTGGSSPGCVRHAGAAAHVRQRSARLSQILQLNLLWIVCWGLLLLWVGPAGLGSAAHAAGRDARSGGCTRCGDDTPCGAVRVRGCGKHCVGV
jgi:hypothetical protein